MFLQKIGFTKLLKMFIFLGFVGFFIYLSLSSLAQVNDISLKKAEIESKISEEEEKKHEIMMQKDYHETDEFIEKIAREKLGLIMPDEIVFIKR